MSEFNLRVAMVNDPDRPQNQTLALVLACTRQPAKVKDAEGREVLNPQWQPTDLVDVARYSRGMDLCSLDCLLNQMESMWKLGLRRAKRLWETGQQDWR